jgi:REP element-mobilizing transposase RayT
MSENSGVAAQVVASQEGLSSIELVRMKDHIKLILANNVKLSSSSNAEAHSKHIHLV